MDFIDQTSDSFIPVSSCNLNSHQEAFTNPLPCLNTLSTMARLKSASCMEKPPTIQKSPFASKNRPTESPNSNFSQTNGFLHLNAHSLDMTSKKHGPSLNFCNDYLQQPSKSEGKPILSPLHFRAFSEYPKSIVGDCSVMDCSREKLLLVSRTGQSSIEDNADLQDSQLLKPITTLSSIKQSGSRDKESPLLPSRIESSGNHMPADSKHRIDTVVDCEEILARIPSFLQYLQQRQEEAERKARNNNFLRPPSLTRKKSSPNQEKQHWLPTLDQTSA